MSNSVQPIKPDEIVGEKERIFPDVVLESFNTIIARNFSNGSANVKQEDVIALMLEKGLTREEIHRNGYLNVEEIYRSKGWKVSYDKPGFNESYPATFTFRRK